MNIYTQRTYTYIHREHIHKMHKKIRGKGAGGRTEGGGVWSGRRRRGWGRGGARGNDDGVGERVARAATARDWVGAGAARAATATGSGPAGAAGAATVSGQWLGGGDGEVNQPDGVEAGLGGDGDEEQKASGREETDEFW